MDIQKFKQRLQEVKQQLENKEIDEIPLDARPKMLDFDYDKDSYVVVSYSRKDFVEVYLFLAHLYNEGYRFWYDNGMKGTEKWLEEYKTKFENSNCLGTITFFSDNYISDSTKEELEIIYNENGYVKKNVMVSLISLKDLEPDKILKTAILTDRISIENAATIKPVLTEIISEEKEKTIHRYVSESDIQPLADKIGNDFAIRIVKEENTETASDFIIYNDDLLAYTGNNSTVIIPDGIREIRERAFENCELITSVVLPNSVRNIGPAAFGGCTSLLDVTIPSGVYHIGDKAFEDCSALESVTILDGVESIGVAAFQDCISLTSIMLPEDVLAIKAYAFRWCEALESITLPDSIENIGDSAFEGCISLRSITIPSNVDSVKDSTFEGCESLTDVIISYGVTSIESAAFSGCESLTSITLSDSLSNIGSFAFGGCKSITNLVLPDGMISIGSFAFSGCMSLSEITYNGEISQWKRIRRARNWRAESSIKRIKCTDGTIELVR